MARKQQESVELHRESARRRRLRWWQIGLIVFMLLVVAALAWWFQGPILRWCCEPKPTPLPPPPGQNGSASGVLYQANFDSDVSADWEPVFNTGKVSVAFTNGQLVVDVNSLSDEGTWLAMNYSYDNFVLDVDTNKIAGPDDNGIIVLFRLQDNNNYYRFDISSDGFYTLSKAVNAQPMLVSDWQKSGAIETGAGINHIQIQAQGNIFRFLVNGTQLPLCVSSDPNTQPIWDNNQTPAGCIGGQIVQEWQDTSFASGKIGLGAQGVVGVDESGNTTPAQATIGFDNLVIRTPEAVAP